MVSVKDISEYIVVLIAAFANHYSMTDVEAYRYLNRYGAIKVAHDFYDVMHILHLRSKSYVNPMQIP